MYDLIEIIVFDDIKRCRGRHTTRLIGVNKNITIIYHLYGSDVYYGLCKQPKDIESCTIDLERFIIEYI